jgi:hypothetical protein
MILGLSLETFTFLHVVISLVGIVTGFIVVAVMLQNGDLAGWNGFFLASTILTSVSGFFFPFTSIGPPHVVGALSLIVLAVAVYALYDRRLAGRWRATYVVAVFVALFLNLFVAIVQAFAKFAYLHKFAPTGSEPAFVATAGVVLVLFALVCLSALKRYHPTQK